MHPGLPTNTITCMGDCKWILNGQPDVLVSLMHKTPDSISQTAITHKLVSSVTLLVAVEASRPTTISGSSSCRSKNQDCLWALLVFVTWPRVGSQREHFPYVQFTKPLPSNDCFIRIIASCYVFVYYRVYVLQFMSCRFTTTIYGHQSPFYALCMIVYSTLIDSITILMHENVT
jgi:hypothetical protein